MQSFCDVALNLIVVTPMLEEGFDVPEVSVVISSDALKDPMELAQRFGCARQSERCVVALLIAILLLAEISAKIIAIYYIEIIH